MNEPAAEPQRRSWSNYWKGLGFVVRTTAILRSGFRKHIIARTVAKSVDETFPATGVFLHAGSGTAESDILISRLNRRFIALDFVREPLLTAKMQPNSYQCVMGNIKSLPIKANFMDGIWNVGVHEHFTPAENSEIFTQFFRVLKPGGKLVVFWPAKYTPYMAVKTTSETMVRIFQKGFSFFPDEINKGRSKSHVRSELENSGFRVLSITMSFRDLFIFYSAVAEKPF